MAETSKNKIYYNDDENSVADVLTDMKKMAESTDKAIENSRYDDTETKKDILNIQKKQDDSVAEIQEKLENLRNITNVLPTVSEKGENITLNNTAKNVRFRKFKIGGNVKQEITTQVNYFTGKNIKAGTRNGVEYSFDNSILILNGTTTNTGDIREITTTGIILEPGKYTATAIVLDGTYIKPTNKDFTIYIRNKDNGLILGASGSNFNKSSKVGSSITISEKTYIYIQVYANAKDIVFNNLKIGIQIEKGDAFKKFEQFVLDSPTPDDSREIGTVQKSLKTIIEKSDKTQKQEYIIPVQNEMLEGDYFDWNNEEEVHGWKKIILNGTENWQLYSAGTNISRRFGLALTENVPRKETEKYGKGYSTHFKITQFINGDLSIFLQVEPNNWYIAVTDVNSRWSSIVEFKSWLKAKYAAGTPVIIYYKTAAETRIPFTDEQKAVAKEIQKATSYEDTTHICSTDEVSPVFDVEAVADIRKLIANISTTAEGER